MDGKMWEKRRRRPSFCARPVRLTSWELYSNNQSSRGARL